MLQSALNSFKISAVSPVSPYLATYARQLGLSTVFVGFIYTTLAMISLVTKPLFGYIADKCVRAG